MSASLPFVVPYRPRPAKRLPTGDAWLHEPKLDGRRIQRVKVGSDVHLAMLLGGKPQMVSFHFGLPQPEVMQAIKSAGIFAVCSAITVSEARTLEQRGVDAIIAQGTEAGGHRGTFTGHGYAAR